MTPDKTSSIGIGAAVYTILSLATTFLILNGGTAAGTLGGLLGCLIAVIAPVVAVWHYTTTHELTIAPGPGAGMGAAVGVIGAIVSGGIGFVLQALGVFPDTEQVLDRQRDDLIAQGMSPEEVDQVMSMAGGMADNPILGIVIGVVFGALFGAVAGAIAAVVFKKGEPEML